MNNLTKAFPDVKVTGEGKKKKVEFYCPDNPEFDRTFGKDLGYLLLVAFIIFAIIIAVAIWALSTIKLPEFV